MSGPRSARLLLARLSGVLLALASAGCGPKLDLGSDVLWATDHESGTPDDWSADGRGGLELDAAGSTITIADGPSHSGRYSLKFSDLSMSDTVGPAAYRELIDPEDLYYSAWYYVPRAYQTNSEWTIQKFRWRSGADPAQGHDLNLRTLPGGQVMLYVFSHDPAYLQAPLANPPAFVPIGTWFQVETFYQARTDETGRIEVWVDDHLVYDLKDRRTTGSNDLLWSPCDIGEDVEPAPPELYIDDAAISRVRVTRAGKLWPDR